MITFDIFIVESIGDFQKALEHAKFGDQDNNFSNLNPNSEEISFKDISEFSTTIMKFSHSSKLELYCKFFFTTDQGKLILQPEKIELKKEIIKLFRKNVSTEHCKEFIKKSILDPKLDLFHANTLMLSLIRLGIQIPEVALL